MKKQIALLMGGDSAEAVISIQSASQLAPHLDAALFDVYPITVSKKQWTYDHCGSSVAVDKDDFSLTVNGCRILFDCAIPMIHGTPGEDGRLQAYLDLMQVPYTTCGVLASSLTFNKHACKVFLNSLGILFPKGKLVRKGEQVNERELLAAVGLPCFIKPNNGGSSFGVSKVKSAGELRAALDAAFAEDAGEVLVEEFIEGAEITCGLMRLNDEITVFPITEIVSKKEFFDVEAKYEVGMSDEITPARISEQLRNDCEILSANIYRFLNCRGIVRIDYMVRGNRLYFLEVNTVPGMSAASIVPKQIVALGKMTVKEVYTGLITEAIEQMNVLKKQEK
jgi:D-alanine-D-alanine ligase